MLFEIHSNQKGPHHTKSQHPIQPHNIPWGHKNRLNVDFQFTGSLSFQQGLPHRNSPPQIKYPPDSPPIGRGFAAKKWIWSCKIHIAALKNVHRKWIREVTSELNGLQPSSHSNLSLPRKRNWGPTLMECQGQAQTSEFLEPAGDKPGESERCLPQSFRPAQLSLPQTGEKAGSTGNDYPENTDSINYLIN